VVGTEKTSQVDALEGVPSGVALAPYAPEKQNLMNGLCLLWKTLKKKLKKGGE